MCQVDEMVMMMWSIADQGTRVILEGRSDHFNADEWQDGRP